MSWIQSQLSFMSRFMGRNFRLHPWAHVVGIFALSVVLGTAIVLVGLRADLSRLQVEARARDETIVFIAPPGSEDERLQWETRMREALGSEVEWQYWDAAEIRRQLRGWDFQFEQALEASLDAEFPHAFFVSSNLSESQVHALRALPGVEEVRHLLREQADFLALLKRLSMALWIMLCALILVLVPVLMTFWKVTRADRRHTDRFLVFLGAPPGVRSSLLILYSMTIGVIVLGCSWLFSWALWAPIQEVMVTFSSSSGGSSAIKTQLESSSFLLLCGAFLALCYWTLFWADRGWSIREWRRGFQTHAG